MSGAICGFFAERSRYRCAYPGHIRTGNDSLTHELVFTDEY